MNSEHVDRYVDFFERLTPERLDELPSLCATDVHFKDPFNDARGIAHMRRVFERMYADVEAPRFEVIDRALSVDHRICYLRWVFTGHTRKTTIAIEGVSEVHFDKNGLATAHIDHWDAAGQLYEQLPIVGQVLRRVRRKLTA